MFDPIYPGDTYESEEESACYFADCASDCENCSIQLTQRANGMYSVQPKFGD